MSEPIPLIAVAQPGLERLVSREIRALGGGLGHTDARGGRVKFDGPDDALMRCNLHLRTAERILLPLAHEPIPTFRRLSKIVSDLPWEDFLPPGLEIKYSVSSKGCRLYHTDGVSEAIEVGLRAHGIKIPRGDGRNWMTIDARGTRDEWTIAIDSTGPGLARRGYRRATAKAPLRETLAAAVLTLAGWDGTTPLLDPACGAGTIAIEAAMIAQRRAPGLDRRFAFERWPCLDSGRWEELKAAAAARVDPSAGGLFIEAADVANGAVKATRENSSRAGTADALRVIKRAVEDTPKVDGPGLVVFNPPYAKRTAEADLEAWARTLRSARRKWDVVAVAPSDAARRLGMEKRPLSRFGTGGISVAVWRRAPM